MKQETIECGNCGAFCNPDQEKCEYCGASFILSKKQGKKAGAIDSVFPTMKEIEKNASLLVAEARKRNVHAKSQLSVLAKLVPEIEALPSEMVKHIITAAFYQLKLENLTVDELIKEITVKRK